MSRILIDRIGGAARLARTVNERLEAFVLHADARPSLREGVFLAHVTDVAPSIAAAFLDLGGVEAMLNYRREPPVAGSLIIVQVTADAHAGKAALVADQVALEGRFTVLRPYGSGVKISQSIHDRTTRNRLQAALPQGLEGGITVRSRAGALAETRLDVMTSELARLATQWSDALAAAQHMDSPGCLIPPPTAMERAMRDWVAPETEIITSESALLKPLKEALALHAPEMTTQPQFDAAPGLFARAGVEDELAALLEPELALAGGGRIGIYETPALTAIDVDSGNARSWVPGQTADGVNAAAAEALARQLRLRRIGGTVVVDFVGFETHAGTALEHLRTALAGDMLASKPVGVSGHGLAVLTRRRLGPSLREQYAALRPE